MANIKSALKRAKTNEKARMRNKAVRTGIKTVSKKFFAAVETGDAAQAQEAYNLAAKKLDQAAAKGVIHKNAAARKKATLANAMNKMTD